MVYFCFQWHILDQSDCDSTLTCDVITAAVKLMTISVEEIRTLCADVFHENTGCTSTLGETSGYTIEQMEAYITKMKEAGVSITSFHT